MTRFLTAQQVLFIHARLINTTGGEHGLRDLGLLESAVARPQATFDGEALYPALWPKVVALMASLAQNHPFVDGNKRTAITSTAMFLGLNGYSLQTTNAELEQFTLWVFNERPLLDEIAAWFQQHALPASSK
jgi:death on curing protein